MFSDLSPMLLPQRTRENTCCHDQSETQRRRSEASTDAARRDRDAKARTPQETAR